MSARSLLFCTVQSREEEVDEGGGGITVHPQSDSVVATESTPLPLLFSFCDTRTQCDNKEFNARSLAIFGITPDR